MPDDGARKTRCSTLRATPPTFLDPANETTAGDPSFALEIALAVTGLIVVTFVVLHLTAGGFGSHGL